MEIRDECLTHKKKLLGLHCRQCSVPVCSTCVEDDHKCHELVSAATIAKEGKENLLKMLQEDEVWEHLNSLDTSIDRSLKRVNAETDVLREEINREAEVKQREIKQCKHNLLGEVNRLQENSLKPLEDLKIRMGPFTLMLRTKSFIEMLDTLTKEQIVILSTDLSKLINVNKNEEEFETDFPCFSKPEQFSLGSLVNEHDLLSDSYNEAAKNSCIVESNEGLDEQVSEDEDEEFYDCPGLSEVLPSFKLDVRPSEIKSIIPCSQGRFLLLNTDKILFRSPINRQNSGTLENIEYEVYQVRRNANGCTYFLTKLLQNYELRQLLPDGRMIKFSELYDGIKECCLGSTSSGSLAIYITWAKPKHDWMAVIIAFKDDGKVYLKSSKIVNSFSFSFPRAILVLKNGNSVVAYSNSIHMFTCKTVMEKIGEFNKIPGTLHKQVQPMDMCYDLHGHIIVAEKTNNHIYLLDTDLKFMRYIATERDGLYTPVSLSFDNSKNLWIGCSNNHVHKINYDTIYYSTALV